jgi:hypothetical protein
MWLYVVLLHTHIDILNLISHMTFDIPFDQLLDVRSHGYINRMQEDV